MKRVVSLLLSACLMTALATAPVCADNTYTGVGTGKNGAGAIEVNVTLNDDKVITAVEVTKNGDDAGISDPAVNTIPGEIVKNNSLSVDVVSGATLTSNGIIEAVEAALVSAGLNPVDYKTPVAAEEVVEKTAVTETTDVLVIGAGMAGLTAALSAKQNGANVIIIDKMAMAGGTTNTAGGILVCVDSELFAENRLETDNMESMMAYWHQKMDASGVDSGYPNYDRLENVVAETGKTVDWLVASGVEFSSEPYAASASYPMALANGGGAGLINMLVDVCQKNGVDLRLNTKGTQLKLDENGAVVGAVAETADSIITFNAKSVILATGGISQNEELVEKYSAKLHRAGLIPASAVSHTGDGFLMALEAGAGTFDVFATPLFSTMVDPALSALTDTSALTIYSQLGVNANGDRFGNEAVSAGWDTMDMTASDMIQNGVAPFWYVYDSSNEAAVAALEAGVASGVVAKGETIEELALNMHVYTKNLKNAYENYCAAVTAGEDKEFGKPAMFLTAMDKAPFYAVKVYPTTFGSAGGVTTTEQGRVTRQDGTVIPGLYAAGEMSNRYFYNENYILAASLGLYSTMGHRAGAAAAQDALGE